MTDEELADLRMIVFGGDRDAEIILTAERARQILDEVDRMRAENIRLRYENDVRRSQLRDRTLTDEERETLADVRMYVDLHRVGWRRTRALSVLDQLLGAVDQWRKQEGK